MLFRSEELERQIRDFDQMEYENQLERLFQETRMSEDGRAAARVVQFIEEGKFDF